MCVEMRPLLVRIASHVLDRHTWVERVNLELDLVSLYARHTVRVLNLRRKVGLHLLGSRTALHKI